MKGSVQKVELAAPVVEISERGAQRLADAYWAEIRRRTGGLVQARRAPAGGVELRLARVTLFRFGAPRIATANEVVECSLPIVGGLLAKEQGGFLTFVQRTAPTPELEVSVTDYVPFFSSPRTRRSVRRFLYRQVQERAHAAISRGYLARLAGTPR